MNAADPDPAPPAPELLDGPVRWVSAGAETRKAAQTLVGVVGSAAAVVFGAGPIVTHTDVDPSSWSAGRLALSLASGLVGTAGAAVLIAYLIRATLPVELGMATLPSSFAARIEADPDSFLPQPPGPPTTTVAAFRTQLAGIRRATAALALKAQDASVGTDGRAQAVRDHAAAAATLDVYERARADILGQAEYAAATGRVTGMRRGGFAAALVTVLGVLVFLGTISGGTGFAAPAGVPATLRLDSPAGPYTVLGLAPCVLAGARLTLPVTLTTGDGGSTPWHVTTLGQPGSCPSLSFTVGNAEGTVVTSAGRTKG